MNLGKQFYVTLLLGVVGFTAFVYGDDSVDKCTEIEPTETDDFISIIESAINDETDFVPGRFIVLTDSKTTMNEHLRRKLENEKSTFVQFHRTFNNDIKETFGTAVLLSRINDENVFLIHANSVNSVAQMYQNLTYILPKFMERRKTALIVLTLSEQKDVSEKLMNQINSELNNMKNTAAKNAQIFVFTKESSENIVDYNFKPFLKEQYKTDNRLHRQSFNFSQHMQQLLNCGVQTIAKELDAGIEAFKDSILTSMENKYSIRNPYHASSLETFINCIRNIGALTNLDSAKDVFGKLKECKYREYTEAGATIRSFTGLDGEAIDSIFLFVDKSEFYQTINKWREVFKNFALKDNLKDQYQKNDNGQLLSRNVSQKCIFVRNEPTLRLTGFVVKVSDLKPENCTHGTKVIEIFAIEKVIIDKDILMIGEGKQIIIVGPIWEVNTFYSKTETIGHRLINLSGKNGAAHNDRQAEDGRKEGNKNGAHGLAGLPGGPAGSFYGIANEIINAKKLIILANGGRGGNGQHGGNGADGPDGRTYTGEPKLDCSRNEIGFFYSPLRDSGLPPDVAATVVINKKYVILAKKAKTGGSGGNGGVKGRGGQRGNVTIIELSSQNKNQINFSALDGKVGKDGIGGQSASGGEHGKDVKVRLNCYSTFLISKSSLGTLIPLTNTTERAKNGSVGKSGTSQKRKLEPESLQFANTFPRSLNEYKIYLRSILSESGSTEEKEKWSFYNRLNTEEKITKLYDTLSLVEDFLGLEKQFFYLKNKIKFTSSYEQLENRTTSFKNNYNSHRTTECISIIEDLETDIRGRLESVKYIHSYDKIDTRIEIEDSHPLILKLTNLNNFKVTENVLNTQKNRTFELEKKIASGTKITNDVILDVISDTEDNLDKTLDSILSDISELENKTYRDLIALDKSRQELKQTMNLKILYGILKIGCGALVLINPALGLLGGMVASAITVYEATTTENTTGYLPVWTKAAENWVKLPEDYFNTLKKHEEEVLKVQKEEISKTLETADDNEKEITNKVVSLTSNFVGENAKNSFATNSKELPQIYNQMEEQLEAEKNKVENSKERPFFEKGLAVTKYLKATSEAFKTGTDTALSIMKDNDKVNEIYKAIKNNTNASTALHKMEENIYKIVSPMLNTMKTKLNHVAHNLQNMNEFQRAVLQWNITGTIEDVKQILSDATTGLDSHNHVMKSFQKLIREFDLLFEQSKNLETSKEKLKDIKYNTKLHLAHDSNFRIRDDNLRYALAELDVMRTLNYVAETYHKWFSLFKQHVFPYHGDKLEKLKKIDESPEYAILTFKDDIVENMNDLKLISQSKDINIELESTKLNGSKYFDYRAKYAFYIWKNNETGSAINDILDGKEKILIADIRNDSFHKESVKFGRVNLLFTSNNNNEKELNEVLKNFDVKLTHHGNSKYKYGNCIYEIRNSPTILKFNYDVNYDGRSNELAKTLFKGQFHLLSPYVTWTVKLIPVHPSVTFNFLNKFKNTTDLELIGDAKYLYPTDCNSTCVKDMQNYYTLFKLGEQCQLNSN